MRLVETNLDKVVKNGDRTDKIVKNSFQILAISHKPHFNIKIIKSFEVPTPRAMGVDKNEVVKRVN